MPRAIWSGSISFGLLNVPVKLYSAVSKQTVRFRELREDDGSRIRHKRVSEEDGEEVPYERIVKGYEISPEQYVVLTREELEEVDPKRTRAIEVQDFVDLDEIDPIYFDHPYYLGPDAGAEKAYSLLVRAMQDERKVAIARFVLRNKEHLAAIRPMGDVLTLATMRFADEIVHPEDLDGVLPDEEAKPQKRELDMAKKLIDSLATDFDADRYRDEYREELLGLIERKAKGEAVVTHSEEPKPTKAPDLMAALEESLAAVRGDELGAGAESESDGDKRTKSSPKRSTKAKRSAKSTSSRRSKGSPKTKSRSRAKASSKK